MGTVDLTAWQTASITTQTTTVVKTGSGMLGMVVIPTPVATATVKIYDNVAASGRVLLDTITFPASPVGGPVWLDLNSYVGVGITVVTGVATMAVDILYV
jgi:hypothetical protein